MAEISTGRFWTFWTWALADRPRTCTACGTRHDRDLNAARNILSAGQAILQGADAMRVHDRRTSGNLVKYFEKKTVKRFLIDIFSFIFLSSVTALIVCELRINFGPVDHTLSSFKIAVIDTDYILKESMKILRSNAESGRLPSAEMPQRGSALGEALMNEINKYTQQGYIVFHKGAMIGYPHADKESDGLADEITSNVYQSLLNSNALSDLKHDFEDFQ